LAGYHPAPLGYEVFRQNDAVAGLRIPAYGDGNLPKLRVIQTFDGGVKRVQVAVYNRPVLFHL
jgi:hypothetical protein